MGVKLLYGRGSPVRGRRLFARARGNSGVAFPALPVSSRLSAPQSGGAAPTGRADLPLPLVLLQVLLGANLAQPPFHWLRK